MWLIIRKVNSAVVGTAYTKPPDGAFNPALFEIKEWWGAEPPLHDSEREIESYDPTLIDPNWAEQSKWRFHVETLRDQATTELSWLDSTIPEIDTLPAEQVRGVVKRLAQENRSVIRVLRYVILRLEK